jgi:uncharacterized membrane protein
VLVLAATRYQWLLAFHILCAVIWVGGNVFIQTLAFRAQRRRAQDPAFIATLAGDIEWWGTRVLIPTSLILVGLGFWLVDEGSWSLGDFWVSFGLGVWLFSFVVGATFLGPNSGRYGKLVREQGIESPEAAAVLDKLFLVSRIELALLILVVLDMAIKPFL